MPFESIPKWLMLVMGFFITGENLFKLIKWAREKRQKSLLNLMMFSQVS